MSTPTNNNTEDMRRVLNGRIPASVVDTCTAELPERERKAIRWFHEYYWDQGLSLTQLGDLIGYDGSTMSRVFRGEYAGERATVVGKIEEFKADHESRFTSRKMPWQKTELGDEMRQDCEVARVYQAIVCGFGESQVGKSENLKQIAREDKEGSTLYFQIPPGATESEFLVIVCDFLRFSARTRVGELWQKIARELRRIPKLLLIIDEGARAGGKREYGGGGFRLIERLRWLQEEVNCGLFFCGTNLTRDQLQQAEHEKYLNQWNRRCLRKVQYPDVPSRNDLNVFAAYYKLPPSSGTARTLERTVIDTLGLGQWLKTLALAQVRAGRERMTWEHVVRAYSWMKGAEDIGRRTANKEAA